MRFNGLKKTSCYLIGAAVLIAAGTAKAGTITSVFASGDSGLTSLSGTNTDGSAWVSINGDESAAGSYDILGTVEGDPTLFVDQSVQNNSGAPWDSFTVTIHPTLGSVLSNVTPLAPAFQPNYLPVISTPVLLLDGSYQFTYSGGLVPIYGTHPGNVDAFETRFQFDVTTLSNGTQFGYGIENTAHPVGGGVPEPMSLGILSLGGLLLLRRRR